jgi:hydrogenase nickel incorporation protein HypA/HybF
LGIYRTNLSLLGLEISILERNMHELGLCQEILRIAMEEAAKQEVKPQRITTLKLVIGKMHHIIKENMRFIYENITQNTIAAGSELLIEEVPITILCKDCCQESQISQNYFYCPHCNSTHVELIKGKELYIETLEVE